MSETNLVRVVFVLRGPDPDDNTLRALLERIRAGLQDTEWPPDVAVKEES